MAKRSILLRILDWKLFDEEASRILRPFTKWADSAQCKKYPELARITDLSKRTQVQRLTGNKLISSGPVLSMIVLLFALLALWCWFCDSLDELMLEYWMPASFGQAITRTLIVVAGTLVLAAICAVCIVRVVNKRYRRILRIELTNMGFPTCVCCGYDLTGNTSGRCPECGTACESVRPPVP